VILLMALFFIRQVANEQPLIPEKITDFIATNLKRVFSPLFNRLQSAIIACIERIKPVKTGAPAVAAVTPPQPLPLHGDARNRIFHLAGCKDYHDDHCTLEFRDIEVAMDAGFKPCELCGKRIERDRNAHSGQ
jgi:hypothetical protein